MSEEAQGIGARLGNTIRDAAAIQAKAYQNFGKLLDRFARRDIAAMELGRNSLDLYIETTGALASAAVKFGKSSLTAGARELRAAERKAEAAVASLNTAETPETAPSAPRPAPRRARRKK